MVKRGVSAILFVLGVLLVMYTLIGSFAGNLELNAMTVSFWVVGAALVIISFKMRWSRGANAPAKGKGINLRAGKSSKRKAKSKK